MLLRKKTLYNNVLQNYLLYFGSIILENTENFQGNIFCAGPFLNKFVDFQQSYFPGIFLIFFRKSVSRTPLNSSNRYLLAHVNYWNITTIWELCLNLTIKTPERRQRRRCQIRRSGVFIVNFEQFSHIVLVFPLLTSNK